MYYIGVRDGKKEKEGKINFSSSVFCPTIYLATLNMYTKFEDPGSQRSREISNKIFAWRERKMLILFYTIHEVIPNICTKFQNPRCSSS